MEWEARPVSIAHWSAPSQPSAPAPAPSGAAPQAPPPSFRAISQRRRSSAAHGPPVAPPPNQPIPSIPIVAVVEDDLEYAHSWDGHEPPPPYAGERAYDAQSTMTRPGASAGLAAVAAFGQAHAAGPAAAPPAHGITPSSSSEHLPAGPDSPPRASRRPQTQDIVPDRLLLSPSDAQQRTRPSSRRTLTRALELAREAVQLDSTNDDPHGAIIAYGRSVSLLSEVMERVRRGEDGSESSRRRNGRRRSVVAQEEEIRRLQSIHDTYADRMNILSMIYSIPPQPHSPTSAYANSVASTASTRASTPSLHTPTTDYSDDPLSKPDQQYQADSDTGTNSGDSADEADGAEAIGTALFTMPASPNPRASPTGSSTTITPMASSHPYAIATPRSPPPSAPANGYTSRLSVIPPAKPTPSGPLPLRPRASTGLPPAVPPPQDALPPAPASAPAHAVMGHAQRLLESARSRTGSLAHRRAGSGGKLASLSEETERVSPTKPEHPPEQPRRQRSRSVVGSQPVVNLENEPLPPLPASATTASPGTPRFGEPLSPSSTTPRPATAGSRMSALGRAKSSDPPSVVLESTHMGTISQRRHKAAGSAGSTRPSSPAESTMSGASVATATTRLTVQSLPAATVSSLGLGRSRSSSQASRRPSVSSPPPPLPHGVAATLPVRKPSGPSRLGPNAPHLSIVTGAFSPPPGSPAFLLSPPQPFLAPAIADAPRSPLPAAAPAEALRKPYHLMGLLRASMASESGGYITRRLHVPQAVWSQGGVKLPNVAEKARVVEVLYMNLEDAQMLAARFFGVGSLHGTGIELAKEEGSEWNAKLDDMCSVADSIVTQFGKKLGVGEGLAVKKSSGMTSWMSKRFDKLTNTKNLDSPQGYVQALNRLFAAAELLDLHTKAAVGHPVAHVYVNLPVELRTSIESKLKHLSEFYARVVLTFVIRDLSLLLNKFAKSCEKWLAE